jgi:hypothetical protein
MKHLKTYNESLRDFMKPKSIEDVKNAFINLMSSFSNPLTNFPSDERLKLDKVSEILKESKKDLHLISEWENEYTTVSEVFEVLTENDTPITFETEESDEYEIGIWRCYVDKKLAYLPGNFDEGSVWVFNKDYFKKK